MPPERGVHDFADQGGQPLLLVACPFGTVWGDSPRSYPAWAHASVQCSQANVVPSYHVVGGVLDVKSGQPVSKFVCAVDPR
eukprot:1332097-Pyramimonas_sp.AAC.1